MRFEPARVEHLLGLQSKGKLPAESFSRLRPTRISLGCIGLQGTNTLAYLSAGLVREKEFYETDPEHFKIQVWIFFEKYQKKKKFHICGLYYICFTTALSLVRRFLPDQTLSDEALDRWTNDRLP
jgi:hypothetical protein